MPTITKGSMSLFDNATLNHLSTITAKCVLRAAPRTAARLTTASHTATSCQNPNVNISTKEFTLLPDQQLQVLGGL
jgi:hypothetical protein